MSGIIAAAGVAAAGSIASGVISSSGKSSAAGTSAQQQREAQLDAQNQRNVTRSDQSPYMSLGRNASGTLGGLFNYGYLRGDGSEGGTYEYQYDPQAYSEAQATMRQYAKSSGATQPTYEKTNYLTNVSDTFQADPSYDWRLSEGNKALDRTAASKGYSMSGRQIKAAGEYNQGMASQEYQNWYDRYYKQSEYNKSANAQNFGQQQQLYQNEYGEWRDAISDLYRAAGLGEAAASNTANTNTASSNNSNTNATQAASTQAKYSSEASTDTANSVNAAVQNALTAYGYYSKGGGSNNNGITRTSSTQTYSGY